MNFNSLKWHINFTCPSHIHVCYFMPIKFSEFCTLYLLRHSTGHWTSAISQGWLRRCRIVTRFLGSTCNMDAIRDLLSSDSQEGVSYFPFWNIYWCERNTWDIYVIPLFTIQTLIIFFFFLKNQTSKLNGVRSRGSSPNGFWPKASE